MSRRGTATYPDRGVSMADGRDRAAGSFSFRAAFPCTEIFRCFQVALDPRKLLAAAAGILTMSVGWYLLSAVFYDKAPERSLPKYSNTVLQKEYEGKKKPGTDEAYKEAGRVRGEAEG